MQENKGNKFATDAQILRHWLESLPYCQYNNTKRRIVETCLVTVHTLRNWLYGNCRIPMSAKRDINSISLELSGVEIFTIVKPGNNSKA